MERIDLIDWFRWFPHLVDHQMVRWDCGEATLVPGGDQNTIGA
jgi:hypothetical protein